MAIPEKLPIMRIEDYHTHYLGEVCDGRLFWGYLTFAFTKPALDTKQGEDWKEYRKEYAVVHTFDKKGNYLASMHWSSLTKNEEKNPQIDNKLEQMVKELGKTNFKDIEVKIFQTEIDNILFGLVADKENEALNLQPSSTISFQEPWDGEYYT